MEATDASLRVLIILDITDSMSKEIEAVKQAVAEMVYLCSKQLASAAGALAFAFITFTEGDESGCHEAQEFIDSIELSTPPEEPSVFASGDDEPENQKAALARTTDLDPSLPTVAFLITDAPPHLASDPDSRTARHKQNYLTSQRGLSAAVAGDAIKCFRATALQHFAGKLVLNCVVYNNNHRGPDTSLMRLYGCFAQQTGGMLMQPESRNPAVLASGLTTVVKLLLSSMEGVALPPPQRNGPAAAGGGGDGDEYDYYDSDVEQLEGFRLVDVSGMRADVSSEADHLGSVAYGDSEALFAIAMERMVAVCGSKWKKRALGMTAPAEQLQFVWRAA
uniref:VWFA domain-containing protein n=1 Tax=Tetradesmus obliquus TaxID=3088 RepID=A0A383VJ19_TETOB|eukprot:jgi/Sobl393_1/2360/SZX64742.1